MVRSRGLLHSDSGPAVVWQNGEHQFFWRGMCVPEDVILRPEEIGSERIDTVTNVELRRVMIERYGAERYLRDGRAVKLDESEFGVLWAKSQLGAEDLVMVEVINHTPEPDGTRKHYFLPVPPHTRSAKQAVAWTFRMHEEDYQPFKAT